jgi:hypothetical protein
VRVDDHARDAVPVEFVRASEEVRDRGRPPCGGGCARPGWSGRTGIPSCLRYARSQPQQVCTVICPAVLTYSASSTRPQSIASRSPDCGSRCSGATRCQRPPDTGCTRSRSITIRPLIGSPSASGAHAAPLRRRASSGRTRRTPAVWPRSQRGSPRCYPNKDSIGQRESACGVTSWYPRSQGAYRWLHELGGPNGTHRSRWA